MVWIVALLVSLPLPVAAQRTESLDTRFEIAVGETVELPDSLRLRFQDVPHDSRCPVDVQCIRAGEARLVFEISLAGGDPRDVTLEIPPGGSTSADFDDYVLRVESLAPDASSTRKIDPDEYRAELRVTRRNDGPVDAPGRARLH